MTLPIITASEAQAKIRAGALLVDVRESDEFAREHIAGALNAPLSRFTATSLDKSNATVLIFHCASGARTAGAADRLRNAADCDAYLLGGGMAAWKAAGLLTEADASQPIEIMRQVQITAGSLVLAGVALGAFVAPGWYGLAAFVGAGLLFAGVSGTCAMARMLALMPWNRRAAEAMNAKAA